MSPTIPHPAAAKPSAGVLPISAVTSQANAQVNGTTKATAAPQSRLKVIIRRLPPGLTQNELDVALGDEWTVGKGKVDWMLFRPGKVSKDLAKPSRPSRAYFQLTEAKNLDALADTVRQTPFIDARNTLNDSVLLGPPILEFAPYGRIPANKKRKDARQGLIDQDPEFIEFLESLTNPITKPAGPDGGTDGIEKKDSTVTVTPLIQHLREKKAAKEAAKEKTSAAKAAKQTRTVSKADGVEGKPDGDGGSQVAKDSPKSPEKKHVRPAKADRVPKVISKAVKTDGATSENKPPAIVRASTEDTKPALNSTPPKKMESANPGAAAARMLQRDLGLRGRGAGLRRGGRQTGEASRPLPSATATPPALPAGDAKMTSPSTISTISGTPTSSTAQAQPATATSKPPASPSIMKRVVPPKPQASPTTTTKPPSKSATAPPPQTPAPHQPAKSTAPHSTATQAFLKHANPSQGITEALLEEALSVFGAIAKVEIDKRKGFAYVNFAAPEGLQKAIAASPVRIAQGSVQVLERKDRAPPARPAVVVGPPRGGGALMGRGSVPVGPVFNRGGRGGGRGKASAARGGAGAVTATGPAATATGSVTPSDAAATTDASPICTPAAAPASEAADTTLAPTPTPVLSTPAAEDGGE